MQRILIVDDNDENIYYLQALLRSTGYEVNEARNGAEALNAALADPPELVISDLLMPIMDGFTLLRQWKADQRLNRIPFVVYTATYTDPKDEQLALDLGADAFIVKPTEPAPFMAKVREVLAKAGRGDMSPANAPIGEETVLLRQYSEVLIHKLESKALELEETNRALSAREAQLGGIIENSPNCIATIASDGTVLTMNGAGLRMLEADNAGKAVGKCIYNAVVPESRDAFRELTERVCHGESGSIEFEIEGLKGTRRWLELHAAPLKDTSENRTVLLGIALDTSCRKRAEAMRAADRKKLEVAMASMADAVFITDTDYRILEFNDAFVAFHKFPSRAACPKNLAEFVALFEVTLPDGDPVPENNWTASRALRGETDTNVEYNLRRKDTGETWVGSYSFNPLRDSNGAIIGAVVVARDITKQRLADRKLRESEQELSLVFQNISDVVFNLAVEPGGQFRFISVNPAFLRATGLENDQVVGKLVQEVIPKPSQDMVLGKYEEAVRERKAVFWEEKSAYPAGEKHAEVFVSPAFNERGQCTNLIGVLHDITEYRRTQKHIEHLNRVYSVLSDINQTIVREKNPEALLTAACRIAVEKGKFRMAWIGMADPATGALIPIASSGVAEEYLKRVSIDLQNPKAPTGPASRCFHSGEYQLCNDIEHEFYRPWKDYALQLGYRSLASFPLRCENQIVGVFNLYASELAFFDEEEARLLEEMAMDISFALEVNRHEEQRRLAETHVQQLNRVYAVLSGINETIVRERDNQALLEAACRIAVEKGQFRMAWIGMIDPLTQALQPVASSGAVDGYLDQIRLNLLDRKQYGGPSSQCVRTGKHAICNNIEHDPDFAPWREQAMRHGFRSSAGFPLVVDGQVEGVFSLYAGEPEFFSGDELLLLDEMAMDISFALEVNRHEMERRKAEAELRWRTAFFEAQVDSSLDGVLVVDNKDRKILQNQRMNDLMNIPKEIAEDTDDIQQRKFVRDRIKAPDQFIEKIEFLNSHPDEVCNDEVEFLDGTVVERYSSPVRDKAGNYYGRIWTFRDITQRRQLEEQFRQAQKMEAVGQLTGGIAHDFNNLLTVILGCSEFIGEEVKENPRLSKMAQMILEAAQRGAELTHRMLAFARRQALQPKPVDINRMLVDIESFLRRTLSADIELEVIRSGEDCTALVDLTQLESALLNLCVNARDAMPEGGHLIVETGIVELDSSYAEQNADVTPGQYILIAVSDTGCGISRENLSRVFDPFFTTKEVGKGTGLGLSMVYGFVKQSKGHVRIYSEPGHGTSVKLYLPQADRKSEPSNREATLIADLHGAETILLVEDNEPVREFAKAQLLSLGYKVLEAARGKEALAILRKHKNIDLLFTDVVMPGGLNGRELAHEARKLYPALKVLFCTGYAESAILHMGLMDKDVQLLNKPYSRLQLARRIREMLTASQSACEEEERND
jgi:PAS domain S-box-containing protein